MDIATLGLRVDGRGAIRTIDDFDRSATRASRSGSAMERMARDLRRALLGLGLALSGREMVQYADDWKLIQARIGLVTASHEEMLAVQKQIISIANSTRTSLDATATMYTKVARNAAALGASQQDVLDVTEAINQAFTVSGASAMEIEGSVRQLSQAFASGALRGDELNAVLENAPRLAQAIAEGMGVTVGELRKMGAEGRLQSREVFQAILSQSEAIREEFGKMPVTVGGAMTVVQNNLMRFIGQVDASLGVTERMSRALLVVADNLDDVVVVIGAATSAWVAYTIWANRVIIVNGLITAGQMIQGFINLARGVELTARSMALLQATGRGAIGILVAVGGAAIGFAIFRELVDKIMNSTSDLNEEMVDLERKISGAAAATGGLTDEQRKQLEAAEDMVRTAEQSARLAGMPAQAAARQRVEFEALNRTIEAQRELKGGVLEKTLEAIEAARVWGHVELDNAQKLEEQENRLSRVREIYENVIENLQRSFADFFSNVFENGLTSFRSLFEAIRGMFFRLMAELISARIMKNLTERLGDLLGTNVPTGSSGDPLPKNAGGIPMIEGVVATGRSSWMKRLLQLSAGALVGAGIGSSIGGATGNGILGGLFGAGSGAATGAMAAGPMGAIVGAIAGLGAGILGAWSQHRREQAEHRRILQDNNTALARLRESMDGASGTRFTAGASAVARLMQFIDDFNRNPQQNWRFPAEDAEIARRMADELGINLYDSKGKIIPAALAQLREAIELTIESITKFGNNLTDIQKQQEAYNKIFGVEDSPLQKSQDALAIIQKMAPELFNRFGLGGLDLSTTQGRGAARDAFKEIYRLIESGQLTPELLGAFTDKNQLLDAILSTVSALDLFGESLMNVATDVPKAINQALFEQMYATNLSGGSTGPGGGGGTGGGGSVTRPGTRPSVTLVFQEGSVVYNRDDSPEDFARNMEAAAEYIYRRGGAIHLPGANTADE